MEAQFEDTYHQIETEHFWFKSRRRYIRQLLKDTPKDAKILDIGCSSGILLNELVEDGFKKDNLYGIDVSEKAIANCKSNGIKHAFVMDAQDITLNHNFDVIIASDCLEHLRDDEKALKNWYNLLEETGSLYVFVPAFMSLWSHHDEVNLHYRRYTLSQLKQKLQRTGFEVLKSSYWNFFLFIPVWIFRQIGKLQKTQKATGDLDGVPAANSLLLGIISLENRLLRWVSFPFGVSTFCIVKKR